jgi:hypothetical protein
MFLVSIWWVLSARKWFKGPKVNIEHVVLGREGSVIEGKGFDDSSSSSPSITPKNTAAEVSELHESKKAPEVIG